MNLRLRPVTEADGPFLLGVYASVRADELALVAWTPEQKDAFVRQQFAAQDAHYRAHYADGSTHDVIEVDGEAAGRLYVHRGPGDIRVVDIALLPACRRRGIGELLLRRLATRRRPAAGR